MDKPTLSPEVAIAAGALAGLFRATPVRTHDERMAKEEAAAAVLRILAGGLTDTDAECQYRDAATDITAAVEQEDENEALRNRGLEVVRSILRSRVAA